MCLRLSIRFKLNLAHPHKTIPSNGPLVQWNTFLLHEPHETTQNLKL